MLRHRDLYTFDLKLVRTFSCSVEIDEYDEVVNLWINKYPNIHIDVTTIKQQI